MKNNLFDLILAFGFIFLFYATVLMMGETVGYMGTPQNLTIYGTVYNISYQNSTVGILVNNSIPTTYPANLSNIRNLQWGNKCTLILSKKPLEFFNIRYPLLIVNGSCQNK